MAAPHTRRAARVSCALAAAGLLAGLPAAPAAATLLPAAPVAAPAAATLPPAAPVAAPLAASPAPALPPAPVCATAVSVVRDGKTSAPTPLPTSATSIGGADLAAPGLHVNLPAGTAHPPAVRATAWQVTDLDTGAVVAACNAHVPLAPASTLKVLTALVLAHRLDWNARYTARPADPATDGSKVGLVAGSTYSVRDLFHGLMLASGNDAATALSTIAGGMGTTTALMDAEAQRVGAFDTHAVNDSGLDAPGQVSSAYDLSLLGRAALDDPLVSQLVHTTTYSFPSKGTATGHARPTYQIQNHNWLLRHYPGATGVKNGYTVAAGGSYIGSATRNGHTFLVTVLRGEGYTWRVAKQLLDWAFTGGLVARPVGVLVEPGQVSAADAAGGTATTTPGGTAGPAPSGTDRDGTAQSGAALAGAAARTGSGSGAQEIGFPGLGSATTPVLAGTGVAAVAALLASATLWGRRRRRRSAG